MPFAPQTPYLHVYGPDAHHDPVHIIGTRPGLVVLLYSVLDALLARDPKRRVTYVADGEGAELHVALVTEPEIDAYVLPYTADWLLDPAKDASPTWPRRVPGGER